MSKELESLPNSVIVGFSKNHKIVKIIEELRNLRESVNIMFEENELSIKVLDTTHAILLNIKMNKEDFNFFKVNNECVLGIHLNELNKVFQSVPDKGYIQLSYDENVNDDFYYIQSKGNNNLKINHKLRLLDIEEESLESIDYDCMVTLKYDIKLLYDFIHKLSNNNDSDYKFVCCLKNNNFIIDLQNINGNLHQLQFTGDNCEIDYDLTESEDSDNDVNCDKENKNDKCEVLGIFNLGLVKSCLRFYKVHKYLNFK